MTDLNITETEAAELEGAAVLDLHNADDVTDLQRIEQHKTLSAQRAAIDAQLKDLRTDLLKSLSARGADTIVHDGKIIARRSNVVSTRIDAKKLKLELGEQIAEFQVVTSAVRLTVPTK